MLQVERAKLKFLLQGRALSVPLTGRCKLGGVYTVGVRKDHPICRAKVTAVEDGEMTIQLAHEEAPRLLARHSQHGYVDTSARAMSGEPEAVSELDQRRITRDVRDRERERLRESKDRILAEVASLEGDVDARTRRRLRNLRRVAAAL